MKKGVFFLILIIIIVVSIVFLFKIKPLITGFAIFFIGSSSEFDEGTYNQTFYNSTIGAVQLNLSGGFTAGEYLSKVFDAGSTAIWNNISWGEELPTALNTLIMNPTYAEDEYGGDITSDVIASEGTVTWERVEVQTWNDSVPADVTIDSVVGYCEVDSIDAGAQIGFQVSRDNGANWDSEVCVQDAAVTTFECDLKGNSTVDTANEVNNLQLRCTQPTAGAGDYYSTDWVYVEVQYTSSPTSLKLQARSDDDDSNWGSWLGPDGTSTTYYTNATGEDLNVLDNRYFQYKFDFETNDTSYTPELYNVTIDYTPGNETNQTNQTSDTGTLSFSVQTNIIITLTDDTINLGSLTPDENKSSEDVNDFFTIRNDGSIDFDAYAYGITSPFSSTTDNANTLPNNYYFVHVNSSDSGIANTTYVPVPANISTKVLLVDGLKKDDGLDTAELGIKVSVPADEGAGSKTADLVVYVDAD